MKVLGTKVSDDFYNEFAKLGNISMHLRKAAEIYLQAYTNSKVNHTETVVNHIIPDDEIQSTLEEIDALLQRKKQGENQ